MVENVDIYRLETMLKAINDNKFVTTTVDKLRALKLEVYSNEFPASDLTLAYAQADHEYTNGNVVRLPLKPRLRLIAS